MVKIDLSLKAKLLIDQLIFTRSLVHCHELWFEAEERHCRYKWLSSPSNIRLGPSGILKEFGEELLLLESVEVSRRGILWERQVQLGEDPGGRP